MELNMCASISKLFIVGLEDSIADKVFALHLVDLDLIFGTHMVSKACQ